MTYTNHFQLADNVINHLDNVVGNISDPFIQSRYVGFVAVVAVTCYELAIKDIFCSFGHNKHKVMGNFVSSHFDKINGRIKTKTIKEDYIPRFGDKYVNRWKIKLDKAEKSNLRANRISVLSSYNNVIEWRNQFAHEGKIPATVTYNEIKTSYQFGKIVIDCLAQTMTR